MPPSLKSHTPTINVAGFIAKTHPLVRKSSLQIEEQCVIDYETWKKRRKKTMKEKKEGTKI